MFAHLRESGRRHPFLRETVLWCLPAIVAGCFLRWLLLSYQPYAYWGSDSESYYMFTERLLNEGQFNLQEKRRFLYPLLMLPVSLLPGAALRNLAWLQHALGLLTLLPLGYVVRRCFVWWRCWIVPVTVAAAALPVTLWYEHELLGENVFFAGVVWAMAGWVASLQQCDPARARRLFWWFLAGLAVVMLMKPAARFFWPGVLVALVAVRAWRFMIWPQAAALAALAVAGTFMGSERMAAWLLYSTAFPLTRLETPLHAPYKAEARDLVTKARAEIGAWHTVDLPVKMWLKNPEDDPRRPLWAALSEDKDRRMRTYRELALEGIRARPDLFLTIALQRVVASAPIEGFQAVRFDAGYFPSRFERLYAEFAETQPAMMRRILDLPKDRPPPPYAELAPTLTRHGTWQEDWLKAALARSFTVLSLAETPLALPPAARTIGTFRLAPLGWMLLAGAALTVLPRYRRTLGAWLLISFAYLWGVFLVGSMNPRFFGAVWGPILVIAALPADVLLCGLTGQWRRGGGKSGER